MKLPPAETNPAPWHSLRIEPRLPASRIRFYDKLNPVWWLENADEPVAPSWYLPEDPRRNLKWHFRNPFHNFDFYVIGVADKEFIRSGRYPERNSDPRGGWDFEVARRRLLLLPFLSYQRGGFIAYLGWRERGAFGVEIRCPSRVKQTAGQ